MGNSKIQNFTDLNAWKEGHKLVLTIYEIVEGFPKKEEFVLSSQMLRAAISVTSNIAEGFARQGLKEKIQFYYMAQASLVEVQNQLIIAKDLNYLSEKRYDLVWRKSVLVHKLITGLIKSLRNKNN